ncbi:MAG: class I SAM-dependent methyltransferase [Pseudonocardiaceae bacterium]
MSQREGQRNDTEAWENFWQGVLSDPTAPVVWGKSNFDSLESMAPYLGELVDTFSRDLPLVDVGCGDGAFTENFVDYFDVVVGTDISEAAIVKARQDNQGSKVSYQQLNGTDTVGAEHLHARLGDANVHLRGVLQGMMPPDWPDALRSLEILTGQKGIVFDLELSTNYSQLVEKMKGLDEQQASRLRGPGDGLVPNDFTTAGLVDLYQSHGWSIQSVGEVDLQTQIPLPDGSLLALPTIYVIATK